ncbi:unnamed protein product [Prunus armeniaca]|uniref:Uncharacterized protein n=1 Tax=Prunus armeniaca TaxID=36596 RepID=A0A6J5W6C5_PRUAR|nr:unnamed protein product [Prunus armeniaca]
MCSNRQYSSSTASTETLHAVILACSDRNGGWLEGILDALAVYEGIYLPPHGKQYKRMKDTLQNGESMRRRVRVGGSAGLIHVFSPPPRFVLS